MKRFLALVAGLLLIASVGSAQVPVTGPTTALGSPDFLRSFVVIDEFPNNSCNGMLCWNSHNIGGAGTIANIGSSGGHYGILRITTSSTSTQGMAMELDQDNVDLIGNITQFRQGSLDVWGVFRINSTSDIRYRLGLFPANVSTAVPTDGLYLRYDTTLSDANYKFCVTSSSTETCFDTRVVADTNWHTYHMYTSDGQTMNVSMDSQAPICITSQAGGACKTLSATIPTAGLTLGTSVVTATSSAKSADLDIFGVVIRGLVPTYR